MNQGLLSVDAALEQLLAGARPVADIEEVPTLEATNRVLARAQRSTMDVPPMDNSAMDGYAVRAADLREGRTVLEEIGAEAARLGIDTFMAGLWAGGASADVLYSDLVRGNVAAWQGDTVWTHHEVDPALPKADKLVLKQNARYFRQYTDHVHPGDVRIGADSSNRRLAVAAAFLGPDGEVTVVIDAAREGQVEIPGLPAGTYYVSYAVEAGSGRIEQPFAVVEGTPLIVEMPGKGVVTVTSRDQ